MMILIWAFALGTRQAFADLAWHGDLRPRWPPWWRVYGGRWNNSIFVGLWWLWLSWSVTIEKPGTHRSSWLRLSGRCPPAAPRA